MYSPRWIMAIAAAAFAPSAFAEVPELLQLVPEAKGYEVIYKFNPLEFRAKGYQIDNSEAYSGTLKKLGYLLKLTDKQGKQTWTFVTMDPFTQDLVKVGVPEAGTGVQQLYVNNLEVAGNSPNVKNGKFQKGNIEFWSNNYGGGNAKAIPGATGAFDFGDTFDAGTVNGYGSMQVHNYLEKQTVFAFNRLNDNHGCDLGIGNNTAKGGTPDWTFSQSGKQLKDAELFVVGKFDNLKVNKVVKIDPEQITFRSETAKAFFAPGEPMKFSFTIDFGKQPAPEKPYSVKWVRTGDDGKRATGTEVLVPGKPVVVSTSLDQPGFVHLVADLTDSRGRLIKMKNGSQKFDGGAGVAPEKLQSAVAEPADFDAFWTKQKAKLAAVPLKYKMEKVSKPGAKMDIYAVSVDCAGPRPVTGYLSIPAGAKDKSLPASASYHGYGIGIQRVPGWMPGNKIHFSVNAHGYDLGKNDAYYKDFFAKIRSNGQIYAFDKKQNSDPETAYFNGMALRVMRSLQFLKSLPQWNGKELSAWGGSQGGLQTIWAAALEPSLTYADSVVTWCCDFAGTTKGRLGGWRPGYVPALNYYDCVFHAKRVKCSIVISRAGLGDYTCPPSGLAILYNNLGSAKKKINWVQGSTHGFVPKKAQTFVVEQK